MSYEHDFTGLELFNAACRGHATSVQQLLTAAKAAGRLQDLLAAASEAYPVHDTALHAAARCGHLTVVRLLLEAGAAVDIQTTTGRTPLHHAASSCCSNKPEVLKLLLAAGANVNQQDSLGTTALHDAAMSGAVGAIQVLLQAGAAVNARSNTGETALHLAAVNGFSTAARVLVSSGVDVDAADARGRTALNLAVQNGCPDTVRAVLVGGPAVDPADSDGLTPLSRAACRATQRCMGWSDLFPGFMARFGGTDLVAPVVLVKAAADAARYLSGDRSTSDTVHQLLSAAIQQDAAATRAALQQHWPPALQLSKPAAAKVACMWLDMWLAAAADQARWEAELPAVQQMVMCVAAEQSKSGKHAAVEMRVQEHTCPV